MRIGCLLVCWFFCAGIVHADAGSDFFVQRGVSTITGTSTTLVAGVDYVAPAMSSSTFLRITNSHYVGAGPDTGGGTSNADDVTVYIMNASDIRTSVTLARSSTPFGNTRVAWEIVEYQGAIGGENEIIVRQQQAVTYNSASTTVSGPTVSGISDDNDVAVLITGQFNPDSGTSNYNTVLSTSEWDSTNDVPKFTRGEAGGDAVIVSYAVIEFTGSNWSVQRTADHTYTSAGSTETEAITAVGSLTRAFIHAQHRAGSGQNTHADFGHEAWLSGVGQVSFRLDSGATTPSSHTSVAWVIENTQIVGDTMSVTRSNGTQSGGSSPTTTAIAIGKTLDDLTISSIFINNSGSGSGSTWPEPMISAQISSSTHYEIWMSDTGDSRDYRTEIVEWPTALPVLTQNNFYFFVNNNALTPTDEWPIGIDDIGENAAITAFDQPLGLGETIRIRMSVQVSAAALPPNLTSLKLQYAESPGSCTGISTWSNLGNIGSTTALWRGTSTPIADGTTLSTSFLLSESDVAGTFEEENNTAPTPNLALAGEDIEFDWAIEDNGAVEKTDYCFRMVEADGAELSGYNTYPIIRTIGYGVQSQDWKWFDDVENETPTTLLGGAGTNTAPINVEFDNTIQLRITLHEVNGGTATNTKFSLQFSEYSDFSTSTNIAAIGECTDLSLWCYADGGSTDNATITTRTVYDADSCSGGLGSGCGTHNESGTTTPDFIHFAGEAKEFAFTLRHAGARVNRVYFFRVYDVTNDEEVPLASGKSYPSLVTEGANLSFSMDSIASSSVIEGVTIDIDTTPNQIAFGTLPFGTEVAGAHRLSMNTNGTQGYQILLYATGDFTDQAGDSIRGILGTNAVPSGWSLGCTASALSCFGYHTNDSVLQGGSSRFSPIDSYARISTTTPEEVAFSSSPGTSDTTDIVYRIKTSELQPPGEYVTNISYIAIPIF